MRKNFLITSHTEGASPIEQRAMLHGLVKNLKQFFPDCFILVASNSIVETETQKYIDFLLMDTFTIDQPHGYAELIKMKRATTFLKEIGCTDCFKICYDFVIDNTNYFVFDKWKSLNKDFVSCYWRSSGLGVGTWTWYSSLEMQEKLLDFDNLDKFLEVKVLESIQQKNLLEQCYLFDNEIDLFNGNWTKCDLVWAGGKKLKYNYGTIVAAIDIKGILDVNTAITLQSLIDQTKLPNHILFIDKQNIKLDLRTVPHYQDFFLQLAKKNITWNLIYYVDENHLLKHLLDLNFDWCWMIENKKNIDSDQLKKIYSKNIICQPLGYIIDNDNNLFFANNIVKDNHSDDKLSRYIIDSLSKLNYNYVIMQD